jgi:hypothetical protein
MAVIMTDMAIDHRRQDQIQDMQRHSHLYTETVHAYCDICDAEYHASKELLRRIGWLLGPGYEICPNHD